LPPVIVTLVNELGPALLANTAMLESPAFTPFAASNSKFSKCTPVVSPVSVSTTPVVVGATTAFDPVNPHAAAPPSADASLPALAGHASPPYTWTPSTVDPTVSFSS
jgi:hypothetical protein